MKRGSPEWKKLWWGNRTYTITALDGAATLDEVGREIHDLILRVADGEQTKSEDLGHQEFIMTYKTFEPIGPACLPAVA